MLPLGYRNDVLGYVETSVAYADMPAKGEGVVSPVTCESIKEEGLVLLNTPPTGITGN